jgi:hypothetical protein
MVPFQVDPSWYERYWFTEHPPRRRTAFAEWIWALAEVLVEFLVEFLSVGCWCNTSSRSGRVKFRPRNKHGRNSLPLSPVHNPPGLRIVCKTE